MPKELNLILSAAEVAELNDFLQELPAKHAIPILNYLQARINAQRQAEAIAEGKAQEKGNDHNMVLDSKATKETPVEEMEPFVTN